MRQSCHGDVSVKQVVRGVRKLTSVVRRFRAESQRGGPWPPQHTVVVRQQGLDSTSKYLWMRALGRLLLLLMI